MGWFKKKVEEEKFERKIDYSQMFGPATDPKHIASIKQLTMNAKRAFNEGHKEIEADMLRSLINHINRYLDESTNN
jgi:hypothetical protein